MNAESGNTAKVGASVWIGRVLSAVAVLFMLFDGIAKAMKVPQVLAGSQEYGLTESMVFAVGCLSLVCVILYLIPRTSVLGAILLTGYLGGACAMQVRYDKPLFGFILFPVYLGLFFWGGLYLRNEKLRALIPFRSDA